MFQVLTFLCLLHNWKNSWNKFAFLVSLNSGMRRLLPGFDPLQLCAIMIQFLLIFEEEDISSRAVFQVVFLV